MVHLVWKSSKDDATMCTPIDDLCLDLCHSLRALKRTFYFQYIWGSTSNGNDWVGEERIILASENELIFKEVCGSLLEISESGKSSIMFTGSNSISSGLIFFCISIAIRHPAPHIWVNYLATSAYQSSSSPSINPSWSSKYFNSLSLTFYWDLKPINRGHHWLLWYFNLFPPQWPSV